MISFIKRSLLALCLLVPALYSQPAKTTVTDTFPAAFTGANNNGSLTITWPLFTNGTYTVAASPQRGISVPITNGAFTAALVPTDKSSPPAVYTVVVNIGGHASTVSWSVPTLPSGQCMSSLFCTFLEATVATPSGPAPIVINPSQISVGSSGNTQLICNINGVIGWCNGSVPNPLINETVDGVTPTTFGYLDATSSIQTQLNGKQAALGYTPLNAAGNLSDLVSAITARTNLGVTIGTNVEAWAANLDTYAGKTPPAGAVVGTTDTQTLTNKTVDGVSPTTLSYVDLTSSVQSQLNGKQATLGYTPLNAASNLSDLANAITARTNLGVTIGTNVEAWSANLDTYAGKTPPSGAVVGTTDTQSLTNKTVDGVTPATVAYLDATSSVQGQLNTKAPLASPTFTGTPTAPTQTAGDSSTKLATDAFVANSFAPLASPALTGTPTAPTQTTGDSSTDIATDAFVSAAVTPLAPKASPTFTGAPKAPTQTAGDTSTDIATDAFVANSFAPLASPALTGTPTAPTQTAGDSSTKIATDAFVANSFAPLASPALTGTPTAPTQTTGDSSTKLATDAFVAAAVSPLAPLASPAFTGAPTAPQQSAGTNSTDIATTSYTDLEALCNIPGSTIVCVKPGAASYGSLSAAWTTAAATLTSFTLYDYSFTYSSPETMSCTPWTNDGTETVSSHIHLGSGVLLFNNHQATGAACAANQATFSASKNTFVEGVDGGFTSAGTAGTIVRAGPLWSTEAVGSAAYVSAGVTTNCPTTSTCMMPLAVVGDWTGSLYVEGAMFKDIVFDGNYLPGVLGVEIRSAQESSGLWSDRIRNTTQALYWHSNLSQNAYVFQTGMEGCFSATNCLIDSVLNQEELDNVPDPHGITGGTHNAVNTKQWAASGFSQTGSGPYTVTMTVAATQLGTPSAPTVTTFGTAGSSTCQYKIVALQTASKPTAASTAGSISTCNATLSSTNGNNVATSTLSGAYTGKVYRSLNGGSTWAYVGSVVLGQTFQDIGYVGSTQDVTPSATNSTGLAAGDWVFGSGFTSPTQFVAKILVSPAPTSTTFAISSAVSFGTTNAGTISIVPGTFINACTGSSCYDGGPNEPMLAQFDKVHVEHAGYGISVDPNTSSSLGVKYSDITTSVAGNNTDLYDVIHIPSGVSLTSLTGGAIHGVGTNSEYDDLSVPYTLPSSVHADSGETYTLNNSKVPYGTNLVGQAANGTSGGVPCYQAAGTALVSSALLGANQIMLGGGAGACPTASTALPSGTTATTQAPGDSTTKVATDAFVATSFAPLNSPTLVTPNIGAATGTSLVLSGISDGKAPVTVVTGSTFTFGTTGGTYSSGFYDNENATAATAITGTLPTAAAGLQYCVENANNGAAADTGTLEILTSASGQFIIFTDGTLSATGGFVISGGAARDAACVRGVDSTHWMLYPSSGTWTKH